MPTGHIPGISYIATTQHAISELYAAQGGGGGMDIKTDILVTTTPNSSDVHPKQLSQFLSTIVSDPGALAAPESFDIAHVTSSSVKSRVTVLDKSSCSLKAAHVVFYRGVHACWGDSLHSCPVLVLRYSGRKQPPLPVG